MTQSFRDQIRTSCSVESIRRRASRVEVTDQSGEKKSFDAVVIATHSDQALRMLADPSDSERAVLGSIPYQANETVLHTDESLLPRRRLSRASWNYYVSPTEVTRPSVTYYMNLLQSITAPPHFCVTLNRTQEIDPSQIMKRIVYEHPVYTRETLRAQSRKPEISGRNRTFYCGAYWGYGFHEDGVRSALDVCRHFGKDL
jgi:predicted NAD/FAD-binding protein